MITICKNIFQCCYTYCFLQPKLSSYADPVATYSDGVSQDVGNVPVQSIDDPLPILLPTEFGQQEMPNKQNHWQSNYLSSESIDPFSNTCAIPPRYLPTADTDTTENFALNSTTHPRVTMICGHTDVAITTSPQQTFWGPFNTVAENKSSYHGATNYLTPDLQTSWEMANAYLS